MPVDNLPVWSTPPEWSGGVLERLEWLTDVLGSQSGAEQRRQMRQTPRRTLELPYHVSGPFKTLLELSILAAGASDWYVPLWHDVSRLGLPLNGGTQAYFATAYREFAAGGLAILYGDEFTYEVAEIASVAGDSIFFTAPVAGDWPTGTRIMPIMRAYLASEPQSARHTDTVLSGMAVFTGARANPSVAGLGSLPSYAGFPVLTTPPDETDNLTQTYQRLMTTLDNTTGLTLRTDTAGFGFNSMQYRWFLRGLAEHATFRALLYALKGRLLPVWLPTFAQDLILVAPVNHADASITVKRCGYADFNAVLIPSRQNIMFTLADGTYRFATITSAVTIGNTEVLSLSVPMGADLGLSFVKRISFLSISRQDSDQIEIIHNTDILGSGVAATTFRDAPDLRNPGWDAWNPADTTANVSLSNLDQRVTFIGPQDAMLVRTKHGHQTGKYYFEGLAHQPDNFSQFHMGFGVCTRDATWGDIHDNCVNGFMGSQYGPGGAVYCNGAVVYENATQGFGGHFQFAIDLDNGLAWFRSSGDRPWNNNVFANPSLGLGGVNLGALIGQDLYPFCNNTLNVGIYWDINLGSGGFLGVVPAGFHAGWPATG